MKIMLWIILALFCYSSMAECQEEQVKKKLTLDEVLYLKSFKKQTEDEIWDQINRYGADIADEERTYDRLMAKGFSFEFIEKLHAFLRQVSKAAQWKPLAKELLEGGEKERLSKTMPGAESSWAVILGINDYRYNTAGLVDLQYAVNDAHAFAKYLLSLGISQEHIYLLTNEEATKEKLSNVLQELQKMITAKSTLYIYFSGHGAMHEGVGYFIMHETMCTEAEIAKTAYPMKQLKEELSKLQARRLLVFLDACHSGGARAVGGMETFNPKAAGLVREQKAGSSDPAARMEQQDIMMLASSQANQISLERGGNGIFTSYLLEGLKGKADRNRDKRVTIEEAYRYLVANVESQLPSVDFSPGWDEKFGMPCMETIQQSESVIAVPTPASTVKWIFQSVQMQNAAKQPQTEFKLGEAIYVKPRWMTQKLADGSQDEINVSGTGIKEIHKVFAKSKVGTWEYPLAVEFLKPAAGEYEIEVEIKVGGTSQQKKLKFTVIAPVVEPTYAGFTYLRTATYSCGDVTNTVKEYRHDQTGLEFVLIPGGKFMIGSPSKELSRESDELLHKVILAPYLICKTEVSQEVWEDVMLGNPSQFRGPKLPVEKVSWDDCMEFCQKTGLTLPTEAQWEAACRAGTQTPFNCGPIINVDIANYDGSYPYADAPKGKYRQETVPVASLPNANAYGLFDTHGNVWEWCLDWYGDYSTSQMIDPKGPVNGSNRVCRGGSWYNYAKDCRSAERSPNAQSRRDNHIGFRPVKCLSEIQVIDK